MPQESLKNKTVKGVGWSAVDNVARYAVSLDLHRYVPFVYRVGLGCTAVECLRKHFQ